MKYIGISVMALLLSFACPPKGIYDIKVKDIDGGITALSTYYGKKMVFTVVTGNETDAKLDELAAFYRQYKDSCVMMGILSIEDGYNEANKNVINDRFKRKCPGLVLTEGMYTRKTAATQSELMQWLTKIERNHSSESAVTGPGWKFFIDEAGTLYASLGDMISFSAPLIQRLMKRPARNVQPVHVVEKRQEPKKG